MRRILWIQVKRIVFFLLMCFLYYKTSVFREEVISVIFILSYFRTGAKYLLSYRKVILRGMGRDTWGIWSIVATQDEKRESVLWKT